MPTAEEFKAMQERFGEELLFCQWCDTWKPRSKMLNKGSSHFLGTSICSSCYHNFTKIVKNDQSVKSLLCWVERNTGIKITLG